MWFSFFNFIKISSGASIFRQVKAPKGTRGGVVPKGINSATPHKEFPSGNAELAEKRRS
jgi:hypothetical protein